jgi:hypothetical protein
VTSLTPLHVGAIHSRASAVYPNQMFSMLGLASAGPYGAKNKSR